MNGVAINITLEEKKIVKNLKVVNDIAERGVKLFEKFNNLLTNNEEKKQLFLQVVGANRRLFRPRRLSKQWSTV